MPFKIIRTSNSIWTSLWEAGQIALTRAALAVFALNTLTPANIAGIVTKDSPAPITCAAMVHAAIPATGAIAAVAPSPAPLPICIIPAAVMAKRNVDPVFLNAPTHGCCYYFFCCCLE